MLPLLIAQAIALDYIYDPYLWDCSLAEGYCQWLYP